MGSARDVIARGMSHIERQVSALEQAVFENPGLAFDLARTLVESVCRSVLTERSIPFSETDDLPRLLRKVTESLPLLPSPASSEGAVRDSVKRTIGGLSTTIQGLCELRGSCGFASHGSAGERPAMESVQAILAAQSADAVVGFVYGIHRQDRTLPPSKRALYDESSAFNESVDEAHGEIRILEVAFRASQILFELEPESYRVLLAEFEAEAENNEGQVVLDTDAQVAS